MRCRISTSILDKLMKGDTMDTVTFMNLFDKASKRLKKKKTKKILTKSIDLGEQYKFSRGDINLIITMEELSELQKEISKMIRGTGNRYDLIQEIADVQVGIEWLKILFKIDDEDITKAINVKLDQMKERDELLEATIREAEKGKEDIIDGINSDLSRKFG